ncbi:MAG: EpsG family protein [Sodaliphilus sp.]
MFDFAAVAYRYIYYFIVTLFTVIAFFQYSKKEVGLPKTKDNNDVGSLIFAIICVLFIGYRPLSGQYFVDMVNYNEYYHAFYFGIPFQYDSEAENLIFDNLFAWFGSLRFSISTFFVTIAAIYFGGAYFGLKRLFPNDVWAAFLVFLAAFSTFSYGTNGIKAGAAASLFILALGYREHLKICIPLIFLSWGFHHSMQLPVAAFVLTLLVKRPKWYFIGWAFCFLIALAHISAFADFFASFTDESGAEYLLGEGDDGTKGGFRIDFIIYSCMPILVGYWVLFVKRIKVSALYTSLLNLYLCTNAVWMLCMYANFTNRIAYLSWLLYPIVLIYPYLNESLGKKRYVQFSMVMLAHLAFTLFMSFICK